MNLTKLCESCYVNQYELKRIYAATIEDTEFVKNKETESEEKITGYNIRLYFDPRSESETKETEENDMWIGKRTMDVTLLYKNFDTMCSRLGFNKISSWLWLRNDIKVISCNIEEYAGNYPEYDVPFYFIMVRLSNGKKHVYGRYETYEIAIGILESVFN